MEKKKFLVMKTEKTKKLLALLKKRENTITEE